MSEDLLGKAREARDAGDKPAAARLFQEFLKGRPFHAEARYELGLLYVDSGQFGQAEFLFAGAVQLEPRFANARCMRGIALAKLKRLPEALSAFGAALHAKPDLIDALVNRGTALQEMKAYDDALRDFRAALAIAPQNAFAWNNLGTTFMALKRFDEALGCYDKALEALPGFAEALTNRDIALVERGQVDRCTPGFVAALFDDASGHFDEMMRALDYHGHEQLRSLARRLLDDAAKGLRILDLGCGTGLAGAAFKDLAEGGRLDGIDLSRRMIAASRERRLYDDLILGDIEAVLAEDGSQYDLVLAADTMVYFGDLRPCFDGVRRRLVPGGFFLFLVEAKAGEGWENPPSHRFRHSEAYLRTLAHATGFAVRALEPCIMRYENAAPVEAFAVALQPGE